MRNPAITVALAAILAVAAAPLAFAQSGKSGGDANSSGLSPSGKMDGAKEQQKSGGSSGGSSSGKMQRGDSGGTSTGSPSSGGMTK